MSNADIIHRLHGKIDSSILPLITSDYVFWGLPYYINPGDTLIWEGALDLLKGCKYKCLGTCGWDEYKYRPLSKDTVILIIGGGFFGDVWRNAWDCVMDTITQYPDNPIIILPQSIHYDNQTVAKSDAQRLSKCSKLTICVRDQRSFDYGKSVFSNNIILVPDLAFHLPINKYRKDIVNSGRTLYVKRADKEKPAVELKSLDNVDVRDWPDMDEKLTGSLRIVMGLYARIRPYKSSKFIEWIISKLMYYFQRRIIIKNAVDFIDQYDTVYTTRLHVMILSFLLDKEVIILDNSYGKVSGCYLAWIKECTKIRLYE